jgi:transcriptional regulator with XRE-family HTH domain
MKVSEIVGQRVRWAREERGLTQAELGQRVGELLGKAWFPQAVSEAERGRRQFTAEELLALAYVLDKPISFFFLPVDTRTSYEFPSRTLRAAEILDGALIGGAEANGLQALLQEALAITQETAGFVRTMNERANALVASTLLEKLFGERTSRLWKRTEEMLLGEGDSLERPEEPARGTTS